MKSDKQMELDPKLPEKVNNNWHSQKLVTTRENGSRRVQTLCQGPTETEQNHAEETRTANIVKTYLQTGEWTHVNNAQPIADGLPDGMQYQDLLNLVAKGTEAFAELPANIRKYFDNDAAKYVSFIDNPDNLEEGIRLGLYTQQDTPETAPRAPDKAKATSSEVSPASEGESPPQG